MLRVHRDRRTILALAVDEVMPPVIAALGHRGVGIAACSPDDDGGFDGGAQVQGLVRLRLEGLSNGLE